MKPTGHVITVSTEIGGADPLEIRSGPLIPPIERIKLFSADQWEAVVDEWASSLPGYGLVERAGGAGDKGCDVIATVDPSGPNSDWDNYQCKHYDHPLAPGDIWIELGKLCYYTFIGNYSVPRAYRFVAPRGVGTKLLNMIKKPENLREGLIANWAAKCVAQITATKRVPLEGELLDHVKAFDFARIGHLPTPRLIEQHRKTPYFAVRFGLGLPARPASPVPPTTIAAGETRYVAQLLDAYGDNQGAAYASPASLTDLHKRHLQRARESFYCAEALRSFSRDTLPDGAFENLQGQILHGVIDTAEADHPCGLTRVNATTAHATNLNLTSSALLGRVDPNDRKGVVHQLANEDRLTWVQGDA
ncbi:ABC-three component system protein [Glacieibacterium megasporae]|uniref:ABC-three component system protein n=1 Tax=Glacieibacterium megasporae TaxID=2835787 RepID=UPI001C1E8800|nr:ABC-three component system protein [Polymorphobacter megasporae]UAJ12753.1 restriction endonuclease [Polymorphobacter megasporae]